MGEAARRGNREERVQAAISGGRRKVRQATGRGLYRLPLAMSAAIATAIGPLIRAKKIER